MGFGTLFTLAQALQNYLLNDYTNPIEQKW